MDLVIYLPLVVPLLAALAAGPLSRRLPPAAATWLLAGSAVALAVASSAVLGLLALTALFRIPLVDQVGGMSAPVFSRDDPASLPVAVAAGALLATSAAAAGRALWHRGRALAAAFGQARRLPGAGQVVVTDEETADAYTLPGWPCRIVVTAGMMRALTSSEREVLLAHERPTPYGSTTCSPARPGWPPRPTRCSARSRPRSATPWNGGPMNTPPRSRGTGRS